MARSRLLPWIAGFAGVGLVVAAVRGLNPLEELSAALTGRQPRRSPAAGLDAAAGESDDASALVGDGGNVYYWSRMAADQIGKPPYNRFSPNLDAIRRYSIANLGASGNGGYVVRRTDGHPTPTAHAFGAAWDAYFLTAAGTAHDANRERAIDFYVANAGKLGLQAVFDYARSRIWYPGRGWGPSSPDRVRGMGTKKHVHIETTPTRWADATPVESRLINPPPIGHPS